MNKAEAIKAMSEGKKVTHEYFSKDEWATCEGNKILLEDGVRCSPLEFWRWRQGTGWDKGWELFEEPKPKPCYRDTINKHGEDEGAYAE